jgi:BirA family biotin operon repressor/biotin-[acetyl-CoA-carboxylase] ligase
MKTWRTRPFGHPVLRLAESTSTIDYSRQWLRDGAPHGAVVIAERQTAGRGRLGRAWASPLGGLWLTVILRPQWDVAVAGLLGLAVGLAAAEAVEKETGARIQLRWPNDLMVGGTSTAPVSRPVGTPPPCPLPARGEGGARKVGGVLVETELAGRTVAVALVSLGLNVNFRRAELPAEVQATATTLLEATGREHSLPVLAARFLETLEGALGAVTDDPQALQTLWRGRDALLGKQVSVVTAGKTLAGRAAGIDQEGRLLLATGVLGRIAVATGEVVSVREQGREDPQVLAE